MALMHDVAEKLAASCDRCVLGSAAGRGFLCMCLVSPSLRVNRW